MVLNLLLLQLLLIPILASSISNPTININCPYDIDTAMHMIPSDCYANSTIPTATTCCWYVYAAYMYASIRYSHLTGIAFLPSTAAYACVSSFSSSLLLRRLVHPSLLNSSSCDLSGDPLSLSSGRRPCQFPYVSNISSVVDFSSPVRVCTSRSVDLDRSADCSACQNSVITATFSLLDATNSKEFVPCGMAATIGIWAGESPSVAKFRSYALCLLQVLENVGDLSTDNLIPTPYTHGAPSTSSNSNTSRSRSIKVAVGSASAALVSVAAIITLVLLIKKRRRSGSMDLTTAVLSGSPLPTEGLYIFTKSELKNATDDFSDKLLLGEGGAGKVYLGKLPSGQHVAIKRIHEKKKLGEFYREVEILAKLRHRNLATLVGYCVRSREHLLVYEYMPGGNLARALYHGELTWHQRVRIAVDVAEGLVYLHELPDGAVVHRDVKPTNVLLTDSRQAKLSDFGVSRIMPLDGSHVSTELRGTLGYVDPESFSAGHVSESADVYSFGVVLLELVTGMKAVVPTPSGGAESIVQVARGAMADGEDWTSIVDPKLGPEWDRSSVKEAFGLGFKCVRPYKNERPRMVEVLGVLKRVLLDLESGMVPVLDEVSHSGPSVEEDQESEEITSMSSSSKLSPPPVQAWSSSI